MKSIGLLLLFVISASAQQTPAALPNGFGKTLSSGATYPNASGPAIVNAASYLPGISPGGLSTIFGQDLSSVNGVVVANTNPLPLTLANVAVNINGRPAPIFSVAYSGGQDQISFQVPYATETGPGAAEVQVYNNGGLVADFNTDSFTEDPGIFVYQGKYAIAAHSSDNSLVGPNDPAVRGEVLTLYTTGLGPLSINLQDGYGAPSNPLAYTADPSQVVVAGEVATVLFSGLGPGFVGLYQINFVVPRDAPAGDLDIQIQTTYGNSNTASISVR